MKNKIKSQNNGLKVLKLLKNRRNKIKIKYNDKIKILLRYHKLKYLQINIMIYSWKVIQKNYIKLNNIIQIII